MKAVILAGGKGTRLAPYTTVLPKPLMPIGNMPILELLIRQLRQNGITEVVLAVGYLSQLIKAVFGDGSELGVRITYSQEEKPLGTAGPIAKVIDRLGDTFLLMNGDLLTTLSFDRFIANHKAKGADASIAIFRREIAIDFGLVEFDGENRLLGYREKPRYDHYVSMGLYVLNAAAVAPHLVDGQYLDMPDLMLKLRDSGKHVTCYHEESFWLDIGRPDDYKLANDVFEKRTREFLSDAGP